MSEIPNCSLGGVERSTFGVVARTAAFISNLVITTLEISYRKQVRMTNAEANVPLWPLDDRRGAGGLSAAFSLKRIVTQLWHSTNPLRR